MGAHVVVDDFGTGYSSLGLPQALSRRRGQDRPLARRAASPSGADAAALTRAVIAMAHSLELQVIAEGVETRAQWDFLSEHGCDAMQGNYYCAPAPEETVTAMLLQQPHGAVAQSRTCSSSGRGAGRARRAERDPETRSRDAEPSAAHDLCYTCPDRRPGGAP